MILSIKSINKNKYQLFSKMDIPNRLDNLLMQFGYSLHLSSKTESLDVKMAAEIAA